MDYFSRLNQFDLLSKLNRLQDLSSSFSLMKYIIYFSELNDSVTGSRVDTSPSKSFSTLKGRGVEKWVEKPFLTPRQLKFILRSKKMLSTFQFRFAESRCLQSLKLYNQSKVFDKGQGFLSGLALIVQQTS